MLRLPLFLVGLAAAASAAAGDLTGSVTGMWVRWDAAHYLRIADVGYRSSGEDALFIVFFPLFPLLVALTDFVVRNLVVASLIVTTLCSIGAGWLLHRLVALDSSEDEGWRAVVLLFAFPTAYALFAPFSESLFLLCVLGSIYAARTKRWWIAGMAGLAATATRLVGLALVPALLVEALSQRGEEESTSRRLGAIALVPIGFLSYLAINAGVHGDPLHFLQVQEEHWFQRAVPPWISVRDGIAGLQGIDWGVESLLVYPARLGAIAFALALLAYGWRSLRWADRTFAGATLLMTMSAAWLISLPRYLLAIYPLFMTMARLGRRKWLFWGAAAAGFAVQLFLFSRFTRGMWAF